MATKDVEDTLDKFFEDASSYLRKPDPRGLALMRNVFSKVAKDFNIGPGDRKLRRSLALIIVCAMEDDRNDDDEVFENAYRWMSYISHSPEPAPF